MKSIFEKWKRIFKRGKKHRCTRDELHDEVDTEVDYDPVSPEEVKEIQKTFTDNARLGWRRVAIRRRSKSVPKLFNETNSPNVELLDSPNTSPVKRLLFGC